MKNDQNNESLFPADMPMEGFSEEEAQKIKDIDVQYKALKESGGLSPESEKELNHAAQKMMSEVYDRVQNDLSHGATESDAHLQRSVEQARSNAILRIIEWISEFIRSIFRAIFQKEKRDEQERATAAQHGHGLGLGPNKPQFPSKPNEAKDARTQAFKEGLVNKMGAFVQDNPELAKQDPDAIKSAFNKEAGIASPTGFAADVVKDQKNGLNVMSSIPSSAPNGLGVASGLGLGPKKSAFGKEASAFGKSHQSDLDDSFDPNSLEGFDDFDSYHDEETNAYYAVQPNGKVVAVYANDVVEEVKTGLKANRLFAKPNLDDAADVDYLDRTKPFLGLESNAVKATSQEQPDHDYYTYRTQMLSQKAKQELWVAQQIAKMGYNSDLMDRLAKPVLEGDKEAFDEEAIYGAYNQMEGAKNSAIEKAADSLVHNGEKVNHFLPLVKSVDLASEEGIQKIRENESVKRSEMGVNGEPDRDLSATIEEMHLAAKGAQALRKMNPDSQIMHYVNDRIREDEANERVKQKQQSSSKAMLAETPKRNWEQSQAHEQQTLYRERRKSLDQIKAVWDDCVKDDPQLDPRCFTQLIEQVARENDYAKLMQLVNHEPVMDVLHEKNPEVAKAVLNAVQANIAIGQLNQTQPNTSLKSAADLLKEMQEQYSQHSQQIISFRNESRPPLSVADRALLHKAQQDDIQEFMREFVKQMGEGPAYDELKQLQARSRQRMA